MECYRYSGKRLLITEREVKKLPGRVIPEDSLKGKLVPHEKTGGNGVQKKRTAWTTAGRLGIEQ